MGNFFLPPKFILDQHLVNWLQEDLGRGDRASYSVSQQNPDEFCGYWQVKSAGVVAGLPLAERIFALVDPTIIFSALIQDGNYCTEGTEIVSIRGPLESLLMGERTALNLVMHLSGIATATESFVKVIADLPCQVTDTRKTTPGLRIFEKYASQVGGARNHRLGLDDMAMLKDNHIVAAGSISLALKELSPLIPYPHCIEVETNSMREFHEALNAGAKIIMLDNMSIESMAQAVQMARAQTADIKLEASGNITLDTVRKVAETGVDYVSTSAPITQSKWMDISMKLKQT